MTDAFNLYFDDQASVIRYLVLDTSKWLGGREVLVSPSSINEPYWAGNLLRASISKQKIDALL